MPLQTLERPLDLAPLIPVEPVVTPPLTEASRPRWRVALALAVSGIALSTALYYSTEATTTTDPGEDDIPVPTMPVPRRDDRGPVTIETLPTAPTQSLVDLTSVNTPTTTLELPNPDGGVDYTAAAKSDQQVTPEKSPLPQRTPTSFTDYKTRGR